VSSQFTHAILAVRIGVRKGLGGYCSPAARRANFGALASSQKRHSPIVDVSRDMVEQVGWGL